MRKSPLVSQKTAAALIEHGADIKNSETHGFALVDLSLMHAVGTGSARHGRESDALAVFLLENGANWTRGKTLRRAVAFDMPGTVRFLLEHGEKAENLLCDITSKNGHGGEIARLLLAHGAPIDERKGAYTPLGHLCREWALGDEEARTRLLPVLAVLLDNGADPTLGAMSPRMRKKLASRMLESRRTAAPPCCGASGRRAPAIRRKKRGAARYGRKAVTEKETEAAL